MGELCCLGDPAGKDPEASSTFISMAVRGGFSVPALERRRPWTSSIFYSKTYIDIHGRLWARRESRGKGGGEYKGCCLCCCWEEGGSDVPDPKLPV